MREIRATPSAATQKDIDVAYKCIVDHGKFIRDCEHAIAHLDAEKEDTTNDQA